MTIAAFALLGVLSGSLALEAQASHTTLLVGEAVRLDVTFRAYADIDVWVQHPNENQALRITIDDGTGEVRYFEAGRGIVEIVYARARLPRFTKHRETFFLQRRYVEGGGEALVLPAPGRYTIRVTYDEGRLHAAAKPLVFDVRAPEGTDARLFERLSKAESLTDAEVAAAIAEFPGSRYTPMLRLALEGRRGFARDRSRAIDVARDFMNATPWPVLDDERLSLAAHFAFTGGDLETAAAARRELFARFPRSGAAADIREEMRDAR